MIEAEVKIGRTERGRTADLHHVKVVLIPSQDDEIYTKHRIFAARKTQHSQQAKTTAYNSIAENSENLSRSLPASARGEA